MESGISLELKGNICNVWAKQRDEKIKQSKKWGGAVSVSKRKIWEITVISHCVSAALQLCLWQPRFTLTSSVIGFQARSFFNIIALNKHCMLCQSATG